ncbi:dihydropteroate synthase [Desulfoscipio gibsoniae]|uniref:Dihydropteroate synthase n=1 Tax=Desulfoscipio gibsoniae DSM 7213 TaxID=767817 RepID=R4KB31_9FIRM|nr:dihydropteroate synthase [Desulfoscipio gibsoniae]AGK99778.1 dihydropteroate synthase [Desulfoscipio gibsoniae DSM 7213]
MSFNMHNLVAVHRDEIMKEFNKIGTDAGGSAIMAPKALHRLIKIYDLTPRQANIIKQEMLGKGGDAAVTRGMVDSSVDKTDVLLMGTEKQYRAVIKKLRLQPFKLASLADQLAEMLNNLGGRPPRELIYRDKKLPLGERTLVMGILNVTPDSFSDGGKHNNIDAAIAWAHRMVDEGADIIDLGGESTRPGYTPVSLEEELDRVIPVLEVLVREISVPISIDTTKAAVARRALEVGAHIINDQWALRADRDMASVVAEYQVPLVMMHNQNDTVYRDLMGDMVQFLRESIAMAEQAGIVRENIIVDPGIGLGKTAEQNLEILRCLRELDCLGLPVLLGTSRKSMIGKVLDLPFDQRVEGTGATVALGIANGADIVRVHDVKEMVRVVRMTDAVVRY